MGKHMSKYIAICWGLHNYKLVCDLEHDFFLLSIQLGMKKSSQLTFTPSFFRGVGIPPTNQYGKIMELKNSMGKTDRFFLGSWGASDNLTWIYGELG